MRYFMKIVFDVLSTLELTTCEFETDCALHFGIRALCNSIESKEVCVALYVVSVSIYYMCTRI